MRYKVRVSFELIVRAMTIQFEVKKERNRGTCERLSTGY